LSDYRIDLAGLNISSVVERIIMNVLNRIGLKGLFLAAVVLPGPMILAAPMILATPTPAMAQVSIGISVQFAPPPLPVYAQPPMPEEGYIWTPGYWQWDVTTGYYWIPGTWILPPSVGVLWTPPYWGWTDGLYIFHGGYWGQHVGYYGGINYGYGYSGFGYEGGRWEGGHFAYNRSTNNFGSRRVNNAYQQNVRGGNNAHTSYSGGPGRSAYRPTIREREAEHENHLPMTPEQIQHFNAAAGHPGLAASHDHGRPAIAATARPGQFEGAGAVRPQTAPGRPTMANPVQHQGPAGLAEPLARQAAPRHEAARPESAAPRPEPARVEEQRQQAPRPEAARPREQRQAVPRPEASRPESAAPRPELARPQEQRHEAPRGEKGHEG
jgi:hypothetical protein